MEGNMRLNDKVAIITGAGSGIGRASAVRFAEEGAKVAVAELNPESGNETVEKIKAAGGEAFFVKTDVGVESDIENMVNATVEKYGKLNILYNNAGYPQLSKPFETIDNEEWSRMMDINARSVFWGSKHALEPLKKAGNGVILSTASVAGVMPRPGSSAYATSKGAVITLTKVLANELGKFNIRVNTILPGPTETPMLPKFMKQYDETILDIIRSTLPLGRLVKPEDIANAALFLASDEAAAITAVILEVDSGLHNGRGET
jgi:3-oxoacyl-[acyl-carrier protein] reductase